MKSNRIKPARLVLAVILVVSSGPVPLPAQLGPGDEEIMDYKPAAKNAGKARLKFDIATLDIVLDDYSEKTGRTLLLSPKLPKPTITLRSRGELEMDEYLQAIRTVLAMHEVALIEEGDKFLKVVPIKEARQEAMPLSTEAPGEEVASQLISQMITLRYIDIGEAKQAVDALKHPYAQVHMFERTNSILITDTADNIARIMEVVEYIDQPALPREDTFTIQILNAKATDIKKKLEEIIADSQKEAEKRSTVGREKTSGSPGVTKPSGPPGVIRAQPKVEEPAEIAELVELAERGIVRGRVKIIADDRTNLLIILTQPENMRFFNRIVEVLDRETAPDVVVKVFRLEFAVAADVAKMLNELIGAASPDEAATVAGGEGGERSKALREVGKDTGGPEEAAGKSKVGELSKENIKILSDERTNALIIMASKGDIVTLEEIIEDMDMMLSQVLIEAVIIDVILDDSVDSGINWIQKTLVAYNQDGAGRQTPVMAFAGGGGGDLAKGGTPVSPFDLTTPSDLASAGLGYFFTIFDLNINAVLKATASDTRSRVVSTPVLLTTDNTEAKLTSTEKIYVFEGTTYYDNSENSSARYRQEDIGLELTVKPHINENHVVMMEIEQTIRQPGDSGGNTENLAGQTISIDRSIQASIAVKSGQTIVLGGQVRDNSSRTRNKVPIVGDVPLLGMLFRSDTRQKGRTETIVFITPYVLDTPEDVARETVRRRDSLNIEGMWNYGWSGSRLSEDAPEEPKQEADVEPETRPARVGPVRLMQPDTAREPETSTAPAPKNGVGDLDPELLKFIENQESRWDRALDNIDRSVDERLESE